MSKPPDRLDLRGAKDDTDLSWHDFRVGAFFAPHTPDKTWLAFMPGLRVSLL
jgi:hypothetical protein